MKTSELIGDPLNWAVTKCESIAESWTKQWMLDDLANGIVHHHYDDWCTCGPIIEREKINLSMEREGLWVAEKFAEPYHRRVVHVGSGPTPLVAAMRCYVASKLGDTIDIPEELK